MITAAYTGMRIGELPALTRQNVQLSRAQLTVAPTRRAPRGQRPTLVGTEAMLPRLLTALQQRWQRSEGQW